MKLTEKQKRFCEEYLVDLNATKAAIRAGYSQKTAEQIGYKLVQKSSVLEYLRELRENQSRRTGITADTVLKELEKIALTDTEISGKEKIKALELLGRHLGMFGGQTEDPAAAENNLLDILKEGAAGAVEPTE
jgi:Phage terminase, small subunit